MTNPLALSLDKSYRRAKPVIGNRNAQRLGDLRMEFRAGEGVPGSDMGEADQTLHESQLAGMVDFQAGNALAVGEDGCLTELVEKSAVHESFENILLDIEVTVDNVLQRSAQFWQIFYSLVHAVIIDIIGGRFGP